MVVGRLSRLDIAGGGWGSFDECGRHEPPGMFRFHGAAVLPGFGFGFGLGDGDGSASGWWHGHWRRRTSGPGHGRCPPGRSHQRRVRWQVVGIR